MCVAGARWVQTEILDKYPAAALRVYAVWFNMMPADAREKWRPALLPDPRVEHWWDQDKVVGRWFARGEPSIRPRLTADSAWNGGDVLWDAWLLYGADARWDAEASGLIAWGRTMVASRESLRATVEKLFGKPAAR